MSTILVCQFYLYKDVKNERKKKQINFKRKINYLLNVINVLKSIINRFEHMKFHKIQKQKLLPLIESFDKILVKEFPELKQYSTTPDLYFISNPKIIENSYLRNSTILSLSQLNYFNYDDIFVSNDLKNEITESSILEKISFLILTLYVHATEHRFLEHNKKSEKPFYKFLLNYYRDPLKPIDDSELFLSKAVEIAYLYSSDKFPIVNQILNVYKKFELNRSKKISEDTKDMV